MNGRVVGAGARVLLVGLLLLMLNGCIKQRHAIVNPPPPELPPPAETLGP